MENESRTEEDGFESLFRAIKADSAEEMQEAKTEIYTRVEDSLPDTTEESDPEKIEMAGSSVASMYADYANYLEQEAELADNFYGMDVDKRLEHIETNTGLREYLS